MATTSATEATTSQQQSLLNATIVIVVGLLATTLAQAQVLGHIPLQNLLKNELHVDRTANAAFFFYNQLPWYFKPIAGIFTDAFPFMGSRRRSYLLVATPLCAISWAALYFTPHQYSRLLWVLIVMNIFMVIMSTVVGGYMVEVAQANAGSGRLTAVRQVTQYGAAMAGGAFGGYLASVAIGVTIGSCSAISFLLFPVALLMLREQRKTVNSRELLDNAKRQFVNIGTAGTMWGAAALMALFYIAPGQQTAIFYRQQDLLHMATVAQGYTQVAQSLGGIAAAIAYGFACKHVNLRNLLFICLAGGTLGGLAYLFYNSVLMAYVCEALYGFGFVMAECALMDLAIRATPAGSEAMGFSLMISVRNLALFGTDALGSALMDKYHFSFKSLIFSNVATTAITIPLVLLLPLTVVLRKDAEPLSEAALPRAVVEE